MCTQNLFALAFDAILQSKFVQYTALSKIFVSNKHILRSDFFTVRGKSFFV
jgi:hypothetical protein